MRTKYVVYLKDRPYVKMDYKTLKYALKAAQIAIEQGKSVVIEPPEKVQYET
jgi:hypothetical protein